MPFNLSLPEILVIGFLLIIFFGKDKLPDTARSIGRAVNTLKEEMNPQKLLSDIPEAESEAPEKTARTKPKASTIVSQKKSKSGVKKTTQKTKKRSTVEA